MKQNVNPAIFAVIIVAVVAVAGFFGFRALFPSQNGSTVSQTDYKSKMADMQNKQNANMAKMKTGGPNTGGMSGFERYRKMSSGVGGGGGN